MYSNTLIKVFSFPFRKIRGALGLYRFRSSVKGVGKNSRCDLSVELKIPENITIGDFVSIGPQVTIGGYAEVKIEDYVRISKGVTIETASLDLSGELPYKHVGKPVTIKRGAWLGARVLILGGVTIGEGAVIGAGAIVSKDVADHDVVVSQPFRVIKNTQQ